jgi:hypothetical protein
MTQTPNPDNHAIDERLSEYRELLAQFESVRDRLRRAEEERQTVPRRVYEKVRAEYDRQLDALRGRMTPLRDELDRSRDQYEAQLKDANGALEAIEEELAEVTFRHRIGEFADDAAVTQRREIETRLEAASARIQAVRETLAAMADAAPETPHSPEPAVEPVATEAPTVVQAPPVVCEPLVVAEAPDDIPLSAEPVAEPLVEPAPAAPPAASEEPAIPRRPVLRPAGLSEPGKTGFENPHDWIDEFGDLKRRENDAARAPASVPATRPAPATAQPAPAAPPSLVFVSGPHAGQSIPLLQTTLTIGREHDNNIEIKDADVARYHARILNDRGEYVVEDMASTTGTWVNGVRAQRAALGHGDVIRIGQTEIAVDFEWASNSLERAGVDPAA